VEGVLDHVKRTIDDPRITVRPLGPGSEPSRVSPTDSLSFDWLDRTVRQVFPDTLVAPALVLGATDSRHYAGLTRNVYRFMPLLLRGDDLERIHGADERVGTKDYEQAVQFYIQFITNINQIGVRERTGASVSVADGRLDGAQHIGER
jgi:carboxypeptidase PM20D1